MNGLSLPFQIALGVACLALMGGLGYGYTLYEGGLRREASLHMELASSTANSLALQKSLDEQGRELTGTLGTLSEEQQKTSILGEKVATFSTAVTTLTKITQTDPQLLAKYSKIYFLNENYSPVSLSTIQASNTFQKDRVYQFQSQAIPFLEKMLAAAAQNGTPLEVISSYRSFGSQTALKSSYTVRYGTTASNSFSADQGYSEHQLGTAVDVSVPPLKGALAGFDKSSGFAWLTAHAHEYGFILSYPASNSFYVYEPWHWRFVGIKLATDLHNNDQNFYTLDQRALNTYLLYLFDPS